jgi:hypothetical protein
VNVPHIVRSEGGTTTLENLLALCEDRHPIIKRVVRYDGYRQPSIRLAGPPTKERRALAVFQRAMARAESFTPT